MSDSGQEDLVNVVEDCRERLGFLGRRRGQFAADFPRSNPGKHRILLHILEVVGDPVDHFPPVPAEFIGGHHEMVPAFARVSILAADHAAVCRGGFSAAAGRLGIGSRFPA